MNSSAINEVSDTGIWVAHYRAVESQRPDALFYDNLAHKLIGERGNTISTQVKSLSQYAQFQVVIRTVIIDRFIQQLVNQGVDTVVNLGAGLDTRPYRLELPSNLQWIEIDFPHIIELKNKKLENEKPNVNLERVAMDLTNRNARNELFMRIATKSKNILVLTEGVISYLTSQQAGELADDLYGQENFRYWIVEYNSPWLFRFLKTIDHRKTMKNAPFQFTPSDWDGFFLQHQWKKQEVVYLLEEASHLNRPVPQPWWTKPLLTLAPRTLKLQIQQMMGYAIYKSIR